MKKGKQYLKYGLHLAVVLGVIWAGMKTIDGDAFTRALREFDWRYAPLVGVLALVSMAIKSWRFATLLRQVECVPRAVAMKAYIAGQSMTLLPGGIAARAGLLKQVGVPAEVSSPAIALSSITDQLGFLACGLVAALFFEAARKPVLILLAVIAAIAVILGFEASRTWLKNLVERLLGRFKLAEEWRGFVEGMKETVSVPVMAMGVGNALLSFAFLVFALHLCMVGVGHNVAPMTLLLAFTLPTMLGRISALPGGFGLTEIGMVGVLDHAPGVRLDEAAAAVLVFRLGTVVFTALCGGLVYAFLWRRVAAKGAVVST